MGTGKKKIEIRKKEKAEDRMVTFSKRKKGLFKKASQLHELSGSDIAILVFSPAGRPHTNTPFFDVALSRYLSCGATTVADDAGAASAWSKDDSSIGMFLNSVEEFLLGSVNEGGADHADGSTRQSVNYDSVGMWLNPAESGFMGEGGATIGDCSARETHCSIKDWLDSIEVDGIEKVEDLLLIKQTLENIREKVVKKVDDAICASYFV